MCNQLNNLGLAGGSNDLTKVQTTTQPIYVPNVLPTASTPGYIPPPTNTVKSGGGFWNDLGGILTSVVNTAAPLFQNKPTAQYQAPPPSVGGYPTQGQYPNQYQYPQQQQQQPKGLTDYVKENPIMSAGLLVGAIGLGVYLFKK